MLVGRHGVVFLYRKHARFVSLVEADKSILAVIHDVESGILKPERVEDEFLAIRAEGGELRDSRYGDTGPVNSYRLLILSASRSK